MPGLSFVDSSLSINFIAEIETTQTSWRGRSLCVLPNLPCLLFLQVTRKLFGLIPHKRCSYVLLHAFENTYLPFNIRCHVAFYVAENREKGWARKLRMASLMNERGRRGAKGNATDRRKHPLCPCFGPRSRGELSFTLKARVHPEMRVVFVCFWLNIKYLIHT